ADLHTVVVDEGLQCTRIVCGKVGRHGVVLSLANVANDRLQVGRQRLILRLADHQLRGQARLDEAREVIVLGDLVEAECQVVVGTDELGRVKRARLKRLENLARREVGHGCTQLLPNLAAEARGAEAQTLHRGDPRQLVAEPAARLRARIAGKEALHTELVVNLVPDFLAAKIADPAGQLTRSHAVRHAGEERQTRALVLPVVGRSVTHLGRTVDDCVEGLKRRYQLAGSIDLDGQAPARSGRDAVCQTLRADAEAGKVLGPRGDHAPGLVALRNGRSRQSRSSGGACARKSRLFDERTTIHSYSSLSRCYTGPTPGTPPTGAACTAHYTPIDTSPVGARARFCAISFLLDQPHSRRRKRAEHDNRQEQWQKGAKDPLRQAMDSLE